MTADGQELSDGGFRPADPSVVRDPYPTYATARVTAPVFYVPEIGTWIVTRYDDVQRVLFDAATFRALGGQPDGRISPFIMATADPPDHTRLRRALSGQFRRAAVEALRPLVARLADEAVTRLISAGGGDVLDSLALPVPTGVIAHLLGVPSERGDDVRRYSEAMVDIIAISSFGLAPEDAPGARETAIEFYRFIGAAYDGYRPPPDPAPEDLLTLLHAAEQRGDLRASEAKSLMAFLLVAGHETTVSALASGVAHLARSPETWDALVARPELVGAFGEEIVRLEPPIQRTARVAARPVALSGVAVPAGARILAYIGSANRDATRFADPDRLDLQRTGRDHLGFGTGIHLCLGAPLARLEMQATFGRLVAGGRRPRLAGEAIWRERPEPRRLERLSVSFDG